MTLESALYTENLILCLRNMKISNYNLKKTENIRDVIETEEGKQVTFEEALDRVLRFYGKYVPYN